MAMSLENLEHDNVRTLMLHEFEEDIRNKKEYYSRRSKKDCNGIYLDLMKESIKNGNELSLAESIQRNNCLNSMETRNTKNGVIMVRVPSDAHTTLAEGEFNRFYIRAVCIVAIEKGMEVMAYRAKNVHNPRLQSEALIGKIMNPITLLNDLRTHIGEEPSLKMPGGPNSGISMKLVQNDKGNLL